MRNWGRGRDIREYPKADGDYGKSFSIGSLRRDMGRLDLHIGVTPTNGAETPA